MTITSEKLRHWAEMASLTSEGVSCLSAEQITQIADHIDAQAARIAELENDELRQRLANAEHQLYMKDLAIQNIKASRRAQFRKRQAAEKELSALADIAGSNAARVKELERELAALREQEIEINDDMALAFHHAISDGALGSDDIEEIKTGLRAAFSHINSAPVAVPPIKLPTTTLWAKSVPCYSRDDIIAVLTKYGLEVQDGV